MATNVSGVADAAPGEPAIGLFEQLVIGNAALSKTALPPR